MQLSLEKVSFIYSEGTAFEKKALDNIGISIEKGEFIGIIGHTGSGKSTLINLLNALEKPSSGTVKFEGEDINAEDYDRKKLRGKVGLVFQYPDYQLFEETVYKELAYGPVNLGIKGEELDKRIRKCSRLCGIPKEMLTDSPLELSGGQKKRVTIASVLAMTPEVLVLDEPTAGLDPCGRDEILDSIKKIHDEEGCTVILVSHSMEDVAKYCKRVIVLSEGRILFDNDAVRVFAHTEELKKAGLTAPELFRVMSGLRQKGINVRQDIMTLDEAEKELKRLLNSKAKV